MNLVWHQLRKEVRQFCVFLIIWAALLLLDLAADLGWIGRVNYDFARGFYQTSRFWVGLQNSSLWVLAAVLPSLVILADSPARREGFLTTRPMPKRDLFAAKMIFVVGLVIAPMVAQEFLHLVIQGLPLRHVMHGALEQLVYVLPVAFSGAAFAALWRSHGEWAAGLAITFASAYATVIPLALLTEFVFHGQFGDQNATRFLAGSYVPAIGLVILAVWHSRRPRTTVSRWCGLAVVVACTVPAAIFWPWDWFALRPVDPAAATALVNQSQFNVPLRDVNVYPVTGLRGGSGYSVGFSITPQCQVPPTGYVVQWVDRGTKLVSASGETVSPFQHPGQQPLFGWDTMNAALTDVEAWSRRLPSETLIRSDSYLNDFNSVALSQFDLSRKPELLSERVSADANLEARVFRWDLVADLPLKPGLLAKDSYGAWTLVAVLSGGRSSDAKVLLQRKQINFATTGDPHLAKSSFWPDDRFNFALFLPQRGLALLPSESRPAPTARARQTACSQFFYAIPFNQSRSGQRTISRQELAEARLMVFQKNWLGSVPQPWRSEPFAVNDKLAPPGTDVGNSDPMSAFEFEHRVSQLERPAPDASHQEVSLYLLELLRLVDARRRMIDTPNSTDLAVTQLASQVPAHLDLLLAGLPVMAWPSKSATLAAIARGAAEQQKQPIIAALPSVPELADVLFARGWIEDARRELYQLLGAPRNLPLAAIRGMAWFEDPQTYPRLLAELEANPSESIYDVLRTLPGIDSDLDATVNRVWGRRVWIIRNDEAVRSGFILGMHHGNPEALRLAYRLMSELGAQRGGGSYPLATTLRDTVQLRGLKPEDLQLRDLRPVFGWFGQHRPDDFVFDPARHKFVLKEYAMEPRTTDNRQRSP